MRIEAETVKQVKSVFLVDPKSVRVIPENNPRKDAVTPEARAALKADIKERGQLVACEVVKNLATHELTLISGFNRHSVVSELHAEDPEFLLKVEVLTGLDELQAFLVNVRDNCLRNEWTSLDKAHAGSILKQRYGYDDEKVAAVLGCSKTFVTQTLWPLVAQPAEVKRAIREKAVTAAAVVEASKNGLSKEQIGEMAQAGQDKKKATGKGLKHSEAAQKAREIKAREPLTREQRNAVPPQPQRTTRQFLKLMQGRKSKGFPLSTKVIKWFEGAYTDDAITDIFDEFELPQIKDVEPAGKK
jgi:hypothetical protein